MRKNINVLCYVILGSIFLYGALLFASFKIAGKYEALIIGVVLVVINVVIYQMGKTNRLLYLVATIINYTATGFSIFTYYNYKEITLSFNVVASALGVGVLYFLLFLILNQIKEIKHWAIIVMLIIISITTTAALWISIGSTFYSLLFFVLFISYFNIIAYRLIKTDDEIDKYVAFSSFGAYLLVSLVVLFVLSEGEILEGATVITGSGKNKKTKV